VRMTVEERDQWECLLADWSASYDFTCNDDKAGELPFKAAPHAGAAAPLEAASPRALRAKVIEDHARRAAAAPQDAMRTAQTQAATSKRMQQ
jgi:hypothetical protein